jgi:hypothetical protein
MEERLLQYHLKHCPACRGRLQALERAACALEALPGQVPGPDLHRRVMTAVAAVALPTGGVPVVPAGHRSQTRRYWQAAAAVLGLWLLLTVTMWLRPVTPWVVTDDRAAVLATAPNQVTVPVGTEVEGDLVVVGGRLIVAGTVKGNIRIVRGEIELAPTARIGGEVTINRSTAAFMLESISAGLRQLGESLADWWLRLTGSRW